jgi:outer membrane protein TolC
VREDKQAANQRRIEIDETRRRVVQDSVDAWEILVAAQAQSVSFQAEVRSSEIALEGVRQENAVGARTILDVLDAEQELLDAQVSLTRAQRNTVVAGLRVLGATGQLTAAGLALPVEIYDPEVDYLAVRDRWFGTEIPGE